MEESVGNAARVQNEEFPINSTNNLPNINRPTVLQPPALPKMSQVHASAPTIESPKCSAQPSSQGPTTPGIALPPSSQHNGSAQQVSAQEHHPDVGMTLEDRLLLAIAEDELATAASTSSDAQPAAAVNLDAHYIFRYMVDNFTRELPFGSPFGDFKDDLFPEAVGPRETYWTEVVMEGKQINGKRIKEEGRKHRPDKKYQFETICCTPQQLMIDGKVMATGMGQIKSRKIPFNFIEGQDYSTASLKWRYQAKLVITVYGKTMMEDMEHLFPPCDIPGGVGRRKGIMVDDIEPSWDHIVSIIRRDAWNRVFEAAPGYHQQQQQHPRPRPQMPTPQPNARQIDVRKKEAHQREIEQLELMRKQALKLEAQKQASRLQAQNMQARQAATPYPRSQKVAAHPTVSSAANPSTQSSAAPSSGTSKEANLQFERYSVNNLPIKTLYPQNANRRPTPRLTTATAPPAVSQNQMPSSSQCPSGSKRNASMLEDDVAETGTQSPAKRVAVSKAPIETNNYLNDYPQHASGQSYCSPYSSNLIKPSHQPQKSDDSNDNSTPVSNQQARYGESFPVLSPAEPNSTLFDNTPQFTSPSQQHGRARPTTYYSCSLGLGPPQKQEFLPRNGGMQQAQFANGPLMTSRVGRGIAGSSSPGCSSEQYKELPSASSPSQNRPNRDPPNSQQQRYISGARQSPSQTHMYRGFPQQIWNSLQQNGGRQPVKGQVPPQSPVQIENISPTNMQPLYNRSSSQLAGLRGFPPSYRTGSLRELDEFDSEFKNQYPTSMNGSEPQYRSLDSPGMPQSVYPTNIQHNGMGGYQGLTQTPPRMNSHQNYMGEHQATPPSSQRRMNSQQGYGRGNIPPSPYPTSNPWPNVPQNIAQNPPHQQQDSMGPRRGLPGPLNYQLNQISGRLIQRQPFSPMMNDTDMKLKYLSNLNPLDMQRSMAQAPSPERMAAAQHMLDFGYPPQSALDGPGTGW